MSEEDPAAAKRPIGATAGQDPSEPPTQLLTRPLPLAPAEPAPPPAGPGDPLTVVMAAPAPPVDDDVTRIAPSTAAAALGEPTSVGSLPGGEPPTEVVAAATRPGSGDARPTMRQVGRYQVIEKLGRGGMAAVYRAHDPSIGRDVAIKFLHASLSEDAGYRTRFLREARAAGGLAHPNIVVVHDVGEIEGRPYMAMELIDGEPLSDALERGTRLPVRDVVVMGIQLARALDYAHARKIVHRDIKPGNIMRLRDSQTVKVTDFGIAHMETAAGEARTRIGDVLGTPQYMSPEQTIGEKLDGRSDLFSVGIVLYQMLAGQRPFESDSLVALALKIAKEEPTPIEKFRQDVPASLRRIVERCMAKAPDRRFQTGRELSEALGRVLAELDAAALEKSRPQIVPLRVKWAGMMALIVAAVMALTAALITQRQYAAMMRQVTESGASLTGFIAAQNSDAALTDQNWETVQERVNEMMKARGFHSLVLADRGGIVRASGDPSQVGKRYVPPTGEPIGQLGGDVSVVRFVDAGEKVLGFTTPILWRIGGQNRQVGLVALGLPERPLAQVARLSIGLMIVLVVVTVLAVAIAMYFVANWFARPIRELGDAMREITAGRYDHRIAQTRNDEFGLVFTAFDQMAQALQDRQTVASPPTVATPMGRYDTAVPEPATAASPRAPSPGSGA